MTKVETVLKVGVALFFFWVALDGIWEAVQSSDIYEAIAYGFFVVFGMFGIVLLGSPD